MGSKWECDYIGDLSSFLFATVMDRLTDDVGQKSLQTLMFADDIMISSESREESLETRLDNIRNEPIRETAQFEQFEDKVREKRLCAEKGQWIQCKKGVVY